MCTASVKRQDFQKQFGKMKVVGVNLQVYSVYNVTDVINERTYPILT